VRRVLIDTNVILDVLLDRHFHVEASGAIWAAVERGSAEGMLAAHAVTTIHYLIRKDLGAAKAKRTLSAVLRVFKVATVDAGVIQDALELNLPDFEDAVTASVARAAACDFVITRDPKGFRGAPIRCLTPEAAVPLLEV
jgi:predicted nucleic acid-binding protein